MSITLTAAQATAFQLGGVTVESNPNAACVPIQIDFNANTVTFILQQGTTSGANFTIGAHGQFVSVTINLVTGQWSTNGAIGISGTLSAPALANLLTTLRGLRNSAETFAINNGIIPGATQVPW